MKTKCLNETQKYVCQPQFSEAQTDARTGTLGLARVDEEPDITTVAHGRAMPGAGGTLFGRTVLTTAYVGCARTNNMGMW